MSAVCWLSCYFIASLKLPRSQSFEFLENLGLNLSLAGVDGLELGIIGLQDVSKHNQLNIMHKTLEKAKSASSLRTKEPKLTKTFGGFLQKTMDKRLQKQYIQGLQQQIKFLEYELKLLKDRDSLQNANLNQLESFFNDGIPINQNILALKNMFNSTKISLQEKLRSITSEIDKRTKGKDQLQVQISKLKDSIAKVLKDKMQRQQNFNRQQVELTKELHSNKINNQRHQIQLKNLQKKLRKLNEEIHSAARANQKNSFALNIKQEQSKKEMNKLKLQNQQLQGQLVKAINELESLPTDPSDNPAMIQIINQNNQLKKKIINVEKEIGLLKNKNIEISFQVEQVIKQRDIQSDNKRELQRKVNRIKRSITSENMTNQEQISRKVAGLQKAALQELTKKQQNLSRSIMHLKDRIKLYQDQSNQLVQKKIDYSQEISQLKEQKQAMVKRLGELRKNVNELQVQCVGLHRRNELLIKQIEPLTKQIDRFKEREQHYEKQISNIKKQLQIFEKQLDLIKQIKGFNLEEMILVKNTNEHIQRNILNFIKKCQSIQARF